MNKLIFSFAGAVTVLASAIALIDYKNRMDVREFVEPPVDELLFVFAAATSGVIAATVADQLDEKKHPRRGPTLKDIDRKFEQLCCPNKKVDR